MSARCEKCGRPVSEGLALPAEVRAAFEDLCDRLPDDSFMHSLASKVERWLASLPAESPVYGPPVHVGRMIVQAAEDAEARGKSLLSVPATNIIDELGCDDDDDDVPPFNARVIALLVADRERREQDAAIVKLVREWGEREFRGEPVGVVDVDDVALLLSLAATLETAP